MWSSINFGKYRDKEKSLPQIIFSDPDWFFWAYENNAFEGKGSIKKQAEDIYKKVQNIKIPNQSLEKELHAEYYIHRPTMKFSHFKIVPANQSCHEGSSPTIRLDRIDMSVPRKIAQYDKLGYKTMIKCIKQHIFLNPGKRLTKKLCEDFFDNEDNFVK